eukprot:403337786
MSSEVAIQRQDQSYGDSNNNNHNQSTIDTNMSPHTQQAESQQETFSSLFPAHLYLNRNRDHQGSNRHDQISTSTNSFANDIANSKAQIGKDMDEEAYDRMPIESFGKSVLSKFGWQEGVAVGRNAATSKIVQPIDYMPRQHRLGLGARPLSKDELKKMGEDGGDWDRRKLAVTEDYTQLEGAEGKNFKSIHTQLKRREKMQINSLICITGGTHKGLEGKIVALSDPKKGLRQQQQHMGEQVNVDEIDAEAYVSVELSLNETIVNIKRKRIILKSDQVKMDNLVGGDNQKKDKDRKRSRSRSLQNNDKDGSRNRNEKDKHRDRDEKQYKKLKWLLPGLIVRVVSKKVANGKLYNTKVRITDVLNDSRFLAAPYGPSSSSNGDFNNQVYDNLREKDLETVIPRDENQPVAVLRGEFKGETGKILSRDKKRDQVVIQVGLTDIVTVSQDDCCQISQDDNY